MDSTHYATTAQKLARIMDGAHDYEPAETQAVATACAGLLIADRLSVLTDAVRHLADQQEAIVTDLDLIQRTLAFMGPR